MAAWVVVAEAVARVQPAGPAVAAGALKVVVCSSLAGQSRCPTTHSAAIAPWVVPGAQEARGASAEMAVKAAVGAEPERVGMAERTTSGMDCSITLLVVPRATRRGRSWRRWRGFGSGRSGWRGWRGRRRRPLCHRRCS